MNRRLQNCTSKAESVVSRGKWGKVGWTASSSPFKFMPCHAAPITFVIGLLCFLRLIRQDEIRRLSLSPGSLK